MWRLIAVSPKDTISFSIMSLGAGSPLISNSIHQVACLKATIGCVGCVGCVPSARNRMGVSLTDTPLDRDPLDRDPTCENITYRDKHP